MEIFDAVSCQELNANKINGIINAKNYSTIQVAINSLPSNGGTVFIPAGTYTLTSSITIPSNVTLVGEGPSSKLVLAANTNLDLIQNSDTSSGNSNIVIKNLELDGNRTNQAASPEYSCIYFYKVSNSIIENCIIHDTITTGDSDHRGCGIFLDACDRVNVDKNIVYNGGYDNITLRNGTLRCCISNNISYDAIAGSSIQAASPTKNGTDPATDNTIIGNVCYSSGNGITIHTANRCIVKGNICSSNSNNIQFPEKSQNNLVIGNQCLDGDRGINFGTAGSDCDYNILEGNVCNNNTSYGLFINANNTLINSNIFTDNGAAVELSGAAINSNNIFLNNIGYASNNLDNHTLEFGNAVDTTPTLISSGALFASGGAIWAKGFEGTYTLLAAA